MAISGFTIGMLYIIAQGDIWSTPIVVDNTRYVSSTGGAGAVCNIATMNSTAWIFHGASALSYGLDVNKFANGKLVDGLQAQKFVIIQ